MRPNEPNNDFPAFDTRASKKPRRTHWPVVLSIVLVLLIALAVFCGVTPSGKALVEQIAQLFGSTPQPTEEQLAPKVEPPALAQAGKLRIGVNLGLAPYAVSQEGDYVGFDAEVGKALAKRLGLKPVFVATTAATLTENLNSHKIDIALSAVPGKDIAVIDPGYYHDAPVLFAPSSEVSALASTTALPQMAVQENSAAARVLRVQLGSHEAREALHPYPQLSAALTAVESGKVPALAGDYATLSYAQSLGADIAFVRVLGSNVEERGIAVRADNIILQQAVQSEYDALLQEGAIESIMGSWIDPDLLK